MTIGDFALRGECEDVGTFKGLVRGHLGSPDKYQTRQDNGLGKKNENHFIKCLQRKKKNHRKKDLATPNTI